MPRRSHSPSFRGFSIRPRIRSVTASSVAGPALKIASRRGAADISSSSSGPLSAFRSRATAPIPGRPAPSQSSSIRRAGLRAREPAFPRLRHRPAVRHQPELCDPGSYCFRSWQHRLRDERLDRHPQILVVFSHLPCPQIFRSVCLPLQPSAIGTARSPASSASPLRRTCLN